MMLGRGSSQLTQDFSLVVLICCLIFAGSSGPPGPYTDRSMFASHIPGSCCQLLAVTSKSSAPLDQALLWILFSSPRARTPLLIRSPCPPTPPRPRCLSSPRTPHHPNTINVLPHLPIRPAQTQHIPQHLHLRRTTPRRLGPWRLRTVGPEVRIRFLLYQTRRRKRRTRVRNKE